MSSRSEVSSSGEGMALAEQALGLPGMKVTATVWMNLLFRRRVSGSMLQDLILYQGYYSYSLMPKLSQLSKDIFSLLLSPHYDRGIVDDVHYHVLEEEKLKINPLKPAIWPSLKFKISSIREFMIIRSIICHLQKNSNQCQMLSIQRRQLHLLSSHVYIYFPYLQYLNLISQEFNHFSVDENKAWL